MRWPSLHDIIALRPPTESHGKLTPELSTNTNFPSAENDLLYEEQNDTRRWHKIRFDNTIRLGVSLPSYLAFIGFWFSGLYTAIVPATYIFSTYVFAISTVSWFFMNKRFSRLFDFLLCTLDLIVMSSAVYLTGGASSPFYYVYFIPLIIHAFHRDHKLIAFNGFAGILLYGTAVWLSDPSHTAQMVTDLAIRLFFMLLTISIATLAINLLKKKDAIDKKRIHRLRALSQVGQLLNQISERSDFLQISGPLINCINEGLGVGIRIWSRIFFVHDNQTSMEAFCAKEDDNPGIKREIAVSSCPAMTLRRPYIMLDDETGSLCQGENLSVRCHICVPINGNENQPFGVLFSSSELKGAFAEEETEFLQFVAKSVGLSLERVNHLEELRRIIEMNSCAAAVQIGSMKSLEATTHAILEGISAILNIDKASLMLWDKPLHALRTVATKGNFTEEERRLILPLGEGVPGKVFQTGRFESVSDSSSEAAGDFSKLISKSLLSLPLVDLKGEVVGVLNAMTSEKRREFVPLDIDMALTFVTRAASSIENALLHQWERKASLPDMPAESHQKAA